MKRDADLALQAYFQALAQDPIPAIEIRLGRPVSGPVLSLAAGACAAAILPLLAPAGETPDGPVTGIAGYSVPETSNPQTLLDDGEQSWLA